MGAVLGKTRQPKWMNNVANTGVPSLAICHRGFLGSRVVCRRRIIIEALLFERFSLNVYIAGVAPATFLFNLCNMGVCYSCISRLELFARIPGAAYDLICDLCNT